MIHVHGGDILDDSILITIKKMLGIDSADPAFDTDILVHINTYLAVLEQMGIGNDGFAITGSNETWSEFLGREHYWFNEAKTYLYLRVRQVFDPPTGNILSQAVQSNIDELGWRLMEMSEFKQSSEAL